MKVRGGVLYGLCIAPSTALEALGIRRKEQGRAAVAQETASLPVGEYIKGLERP